MGAWRLEYRNDVSKKQCPRLHAKLEVDAGVYYWRLGLQCGERDGGSAATVAIFAHVT